MSHPTFGVIRPEGELNLLTQQLLHICSSCKESSMPIQTGYNFKIRKYENYKKCFLDKPLRILSIRVYTYSNNLNAVYHLINIFFVYYYLNAVYRLLFFLLKGRAD